MNRFRRDFLAAAISAPVPDPATYGKITVLTIPGQVSGPSCVQRDQHRHGGQPDLGAIGGQPEPHPVGQPADAAGGRRTAHVARCTPAGQSSDAVSSYPRLIRVAMMYGDKVGYGPTSATPWTALSGPAREPPPPVRRPPWAERPAAGEGSTGCRPRCRRCHAVAAAMAPPGECDHLERQSWLRCREIKTAMDAVRRLQPPRKLPGLRGHALQKLSGRPMTRVRQRGVGGAPRDVRVGAPPTPREMR